jgi:hypothetical protein
MDLFAKSLNRTSHDSNPLPLKVLVTGSPRAGTSFVTGLIHTMGLDLGPQEWLKSPDANNPYGYFECLPLMQISNAILQTLGGSFHDLPRLASGWTTAFEPEKSAIMNLVHKGNIELYKDNQLLVLADLYSEIFPHAKWIFIRRDVKETFASRFGVKMPFESWAVLTEQRMDAWNRSKPSSKALYIHYHDFSNDLDKTIRSIAAFIRVELTEQQMESCRVFYKPK